MEQEIFEVSFEYKGQKYKAKVKTVMPNGPEKVDYEISMIAGYAFRIHSHQEESMLCWKSKNWVLIWNLSES
jgi:hypothetical protein